MLQRFRGDAATKPQHGDIFVNKLKMKSGFYTSKQVDELISDE